MCWERMHSRAHLCPESECLTPGPPSCPPTLTLQHSQRAGPQPAELGCGIYRLCALGSPSLDEWYRQGEAYGLGFVHQEKGVAELEPLAGALPSPAPTPSPPQFLCALPNSGGGAIGHEPPGFQASEGLGPATSIPSAPTHHELCIWGLVLPELLVRAPPRVAGPVHPRGPSAAASLRAQQEFPEDRKIQTFLNSKAMVALSVVGSSDGSSTPSVCLPLPRLWQELCAPSIHYEELGQVWVL